jgi:hypothetical protein
MMTRALPLLAAVAALAGCVEGYGQSAPNVGQAPDTAVARFIPGGEVTVVQVTVSDRRPLRNAELVGPDGSVIQAYSIDVNRASQAQYPQYQQQPLALGLGGSAGFGGGYSSSAVGLTAGLGGYSTPGNYVVVSDQIQSTALIRLTDPQDYSRTWEQWTVRVQLGDPPNVSFITLRAPQPPL